MTFSALSFPVSRLLRLRRAWAFAGFWCALSLVAAFLARRRNPEAALDHVLGSVVAPITVPLTTYVIVSVLLGGVSLQAAASPLCRLGARPRDAATAFVAVAIGASAFTNAAVGLAVAAIDHPAGAPWLSRDLWVIAWSLPLGAAAYGALFCYAASFGRRGLWRILPLTADWVLGSPDGWFAWATPRAHLRSILGFAAVGGLSQRASGLALGALAVVFAIAATVGAEPFRAALLRGSPRRAGS
jgi:hypothetical protein